MSTHTQTRSNPGYKPKTPLNTRTPKPQKKQTKIMGTHPPYLWFDHPELREVSRGVAVLRPEGGSEGVNVP